MPKNDLPAGVMIVKNQLDEALVAHKEAVENNQFVRRTAKMVRNGKKRPNKRTLRAAVNKIQAQKKRKETLAANKATVEKARVIHRDATPQRVQVKLL